MGWLAMEHISAKHEPQNRTVPVMVAIIALRPGFSTFNFFR